MLAALAQTSAAPRTTSGHINPHTLLMFVRHFLYGLRIVCNSPVPGLPIREDYRAPDVTVHLREKNCLQADLKALPRKFSYISPHLNAQGQPHLRAGSLNDDYFGFFYDDGARFAVKRDGSEIWADWLDNYAVEDIATYLVGPVMGFVLRLKGVLPLHACAIAIQDRAIALVGEQGAGKSTAAAAFARLGYAVLSEDVAAVAEVGGQLIVHPGYPRVNLWPESVEALFGSADKLPQVTPTWGKQFLALDGAENRFQNEPLPLSAIFILEERVSGADLPRIDAIPAASALTMVVANTYGNYLLDASLRRKEFVQLGSLLAKIQIYQVWPSEDPARVYELCQAIAAKVRGDGTFAVSC